MADDIAAQGILRKICTAVSHKYHRIGIQPGIRTGLLNGLIQGCGKRFILLISHIGSMEKLCHDLPLMQGSQSGPNTAEVRDCFFLECGNCRQAECIYKRKNNLPADRLVGTADNREKQRRQRQQAGGNQIHEESFSVHAPSSENQQDQAENQNRQK